MRSVLIVFCTLLSLAASAGIYDTNLIPYRSGNLWGYSTPGKKLVIEPQFTEAHMFEGPLASARQDSYYCVINRAGRIIHRSRNCISIVNGGNHYITGEKSYEEQLFDTAGKPLTKMYNNIRGFNQYGYIIISAGYTKKGLLDKSFKEVLRPQYDDLEFFTKDLVKVYEDKKGYSLINLATGWHMDSTYDRIYPPREGLLMVRKGNLYGFIDLRGKVVIPIMYARTSPQGLTYGQEYNESTYVDYHLDGFYDGVALVVLGETPLFINKNGKQAFRCTMDMGFGFNNGYAWVHYGGNWGVIDRSGKFVIEPAYTAPATTSAKELIALDGFHEGLVMATRSDKFGYADARDSLVVPCIYSYAGGFYDGMAAVALDGKFGFINKRGEKVIPFRYKWIEGAGIYDTHPFAPGCAIALDQDDTWVIINKKGEQLLPYKFDHDNNIWFADGIADATANGKRYVFTTTGQVLYTFSTPGIVSQYTPDIYYSYDQKCYVDIKRDIKYCD